VIIFIVVTLVTAITVAIVAKPNLWGRPTRSPHITRGSSSGPPVDTHQLKGWFAFIASTTKDDRFAPDIYVFANGGAAAA
jgi:hypothetical protein